MPREPRRTSSGRSQAKESEEDRILFLACTEIDSLCLSIALRDLSVTPVFFDRRLLDLFLRGQEAGRIPAEGHSVEYGMSHKAIPEQIYLGELRKQRRRNEPEIHQPQRGAVKKSVKQQRPIFILVPVMFKIIAKIRPNKPARMKCTTSPQIISAAKE